MYPTSAYDSVSSCNISTALEINPNSSHFRVQIALREQNRNIETAAMVDSGATALFMSKDFIRQYGIRTFPLRRSIGILNIDGTKNQAGQITHFARAKLSVDGHERWTDFLITNLGQKGVILGLPWLRKENPEVDWEKGWLSIPKHREEIQATTPVVEEVVDDIEEPPLCRIRANRETRQSWVREGILDHAMEEVWCAAGYTYSQQIAEKAHKDKPTKTFEEMVPEPYRDFKQVFSEAASERLPAHKPWDHAINLVPGAPETMRTKVYPMSPNEQEELDRFLTDNLRKGYM